ncbi:hypothetical protein Taro_041577 [Colocasia esculenta]|uniref:Uncharacterized protein n=1 Tax=Colocasia esculenta TaxID=4460 RepID=A0A843WG80_COLES|nr:hypothetical protein [Colocasia esculenta]
MLRIEDALNATKAAIEEGVVVGGGCSLLRLSLKIDGIKGSLDNEEQKGKALVLEPYYPSRFARNFGYDQSVPPNANFPLEARICRDHSIHLIVACWWNYFRREETGLGYILPAPDAMGQIDIYYARWWFKYSNIFWQSPQQLREAEESHIPSETSRGRSANPCLNALSFSRRRRAGKDGVTDSIMSRDGDETDEDANNSATSNDYNPLSGDSLLFYGREYETSSRAVEAFSPEVGDDKDPQTLNRSNGSPIRNSLFGMGAMDSDNTTFSFAELGLPVEQYPPTTVEEYVPVAAGEFPTEESVSEGALDFFRMIFSEGETIPCPAPEASSSFPFLEDTRSPFPKMHPHSAFQVGDTARDDRDFQIRAFFDPRTPRQKKGIIRRVLHRNLAIADLGQ